jgi:prefoldin subunit 5
MVSVGMGFHVEYTLPEALEFIEKKETFLNKYALLDKSLLTRADEQRILVLVQRRLRPRFVWYAKTTQPYAR